MTESKPQAKPKTHKVGEIITVDATVVRPDGSTHTVTRGAFVLDVPGVFVVDGTEVTVK